MRHIYAISMEKPEGKLRHMNLCPLQLLFETCGGAIGMKNDSILKNKLEIKNIHQKIPTYLGNTCEIQKFI